MLQVEADAIDSYVRAGKLYLRQVTDLQGSQAPFVREIEPPNKKGKAFDRTVYRLAAESGKGLLFCSSLDHVDEELELFVDLIATLPPPTSRQLQATFRRYGHVLSKSEERLLSGESWTRLTYAFPPDRCVTAGLRRLKQTSERPSAPILGRPPDGPSLEELSGLGEIKDWGLELANDLADFRDGLITWDEIDSGALISGAPGTGKTLSASAIARTCELPMVVASAAQWQAKGYLNDLLSAMRESFKEAHSFGTALLFIDEIDAIGSREVYDSQHADYRRQVINGLLELLDGHERRSGVIVVGATNHPGNLDPAILRPGRLGRHLTVPLPDAPTREQIFAYHAELTVPDADREHFARATAGMAGAGIKQLVRDAKRLARRTHRPLQFEDVTKAMKPLIALPAAQMRVAAVHEAGHAIVGLELGMVLKGITIADTVVDGNVNILGGALFEQPAFALRNKSFFLNHIAMYLGGLAAEALAYGEFTEAVADSHSSDLALATALATRVEGCFGMGRTLAIDIVHDRDLARLRANDLRLRIAVNKLLDEQFKRAKTILQPRLNALHKIAETLLHTKSMSAGAVSDALSEH